MSNIQHETPNIQLAVGEACLPPCGPSVPCVPRSSPLRSATGAWAHSVYSIQPVLQSAIFWSS
jgi:hypothetical protein